MKFVWKVLLNILMMSATECAFVQNPEKVAELFNHMLSIGCCEMCAHLYSGKHSDSFFDNLYKQNVKDQTEKKSKTNPCISCLGLLHSPYQEVIVDKVISEIEKSENDHDSFNIALTLPISFQLRAHSLSYYVKNHYAQLTSTKNDVFPWINIKDIFKATSASYISKQAKRLLKHNSDLTINVKLSYSNDELECFKLLELCPAVFGQRHVKKFKGFLFSRKSVDSALNDKKNIKLRNYYSTPPIIPNHELQCEEVEIKQNPMFIAGRYNKYVRNLPQSPWFIKGKRRFNSSVQELFSNDFQKLLKADEYSFSSSGREDVDVRMLGTGRPFSIEIINPCYTKVTQTEITNLMNDINKEHGETIFLRDLKVISKHELHFIKKGEESKQKTYEALCVSKTPVSKETFDSVSKLAPIVLQQQTPIRVLHRRANMVRTKIVHSLDLTPMKKSNNNQTFFTIKLVTQAGTYVKEFVTGDFGRTVPNLCTLLGNKDIDILVLDVLNIDLEWPPKKKPYGS